MTVGWVNQILNVEIWKEMEWNVHPVICSYSKPDWLIFERAESNLGERDERQIKFDMNMIRQTQAPTSLMAGR